MPSLRELQQTAYRAIVREEGGASFPPLVRPSAFNAARLGVYRNNARETFHKTLAATYPVVQRLVGELCFRGLARSYSSDFPSRSGDLSAYGAELPTLLEIYYRDTAFAYLADVARLEWACAEAETAANGVALDLSHLARVPADDCAQLRVALRAPVRLVSSRFPVFSIWEANQGDDVEPVALSRGAEHVLVTRAKAGVRLYRLDARTFAFARSLADGEALADAVDAGEAAGDAFDVTEALGALAQLDVLAGFRLPADEAE
jgi:hypothetical protein